MVDPAEGIGRELERLDRALASADVVGEHLSDRELGSLAANEIDLGSADGERIRAHLRSCRACVENLGWVDLTLDDEDASPADAERREAVVARALAMAAPAGSPRGEDERSSSLPISSGRRWIGAWTVAALAAAAAALLWFARPLWVSSPAEPAVRIAQLDPHWSNERGGGGTLRELDLRLCLRVDATSDVWVFLASISDVVEVSRLFPLSPLAAGDDDYAGWPANPLRPTGDRELWLPPEEHPQALAGFTSTGPFALVLLAREVRQGAGSVELPDARDAIAAALERHDFSDSAGHALEAQLGPRFDVVQWRLLTEQAQD